MDKMFYVKIYSDNESLYHLIRRLCKVAHHYNYLFFCCSDQRNWVQFYSILQYEQQRRRLLW